MADERPTHPTCVEAGRQGFFQESRGTKRDRAAPIAPADYLAPASSSGPEQVPLTDMVALADIEHDETVAALYDIVGPVQPQDAGSTSADSYRASSSSSAAAAEPQRASCFAPIRPCALPLPLTLTQTLTLTIAVPSS